MAMPASAARAAYAGQAHFGALDGLRFLAIFAVLYHHSPVSAALKGTAAFFGRGYLGVDFFFVISGFLITTLLLREGDRKGRISLRGFYWRRALRILPLYVLVISLVGGYFVLVKGDAEAARLWPFYYLFLANFLVGDIPTLAPTWSLSVEEQYYLLWPLLLVLLPRRALLPVLGLGIAALVLAVLGAFGPLSLEAGPLVISPVAMTYVPILLGSGLAILLHGEAGFARLWPVLGQRWSAPLFALVLLGLLVFLPVNLLGLPNLVMHLGMTLLLGTLVIREDTPLSPVLKFPPVVRLGMISYGIYLLHHIARDIAGRVTGALDLSGHGLVFHVLFWGGAVVMAELSFRYYEAFFLALRHKTLGRLPARRVRPDDKTADGKPADDKTRASS